LTDQVDIRELWEVLNTEQEWIDLATMTEFCFPDDPTDDKSAAVVRAFFKDRLYFKFSHDRFFPNSEERVEQIHFQAKEAVRKHRMIENGAKWLKAGLTDISVENTDDNSRLVEIIKSYYLFDKESKDQVVAKAMLSRAGIKEKEDIFRILVKQGIWDVNENIDLYRYDIPIAFPDDVSQRVQALVNSVSSTSVESGRRDMTGLSVKTIDGQSTLDFDDALSIEDKGDHYLLGVHIADVGHFVKKGDPIDREAMTRGSSIYMPDQKVPMVPADLAENLCSLKAGEVRPVISTMIKLNLSAEVIDYDIFPSLIQVQQQLSYYDVNQVAEEDRNVAILYDIAQKFRRQRLTQGAVHISLPEVNVWIDSERKLAVSRTNRESPGRMLVAEIMIMANWLMARFLAKHDTAAIFRTQAEPRERLFKNGEGTLFQNWMQRKRLNRFVLNEKAESHAGLGLDAYVTATSPIRKYFDLATQRQIRSIFDLETPYTAGEVRQIIQLLEQSTGSVSRVQFRRNRYWLLKYLEEKIGQKENAIVLNRMRNNYQVLLTEYMIECSLPSSAGINLKPEDLVQVTIQHVNARNDVLSVFLG
ncbi:ribonuclease catalytic domain-containing protein, partial [Thermodesulfobacteriota bacterium]